MYLAPQDAHQQDARKNRTLPSSPHPSSGHPTPTPRFVAQIRSAIKDDRVSTLSQVLARARVAGDFDAPDFFLPARPDRYARRLVWREPDASFVVVAMTWRCGQGSPLHDHAGMWGAEIVVAGAMCETTFRLSEVDSGGRYRFAAESERVAGAGAVGVLIPPLEYHDFGNQGSETAHTVHVYAGDLTVCRAFDHDSDGWWKARRVDLRYDG